MYSSFILMTRKLDIILVNTNYIIVLQNYVLKHNYYLRPWK